MSHVAVAAGPRREAGIACLLFAAGFAAFAFAVVAPQGMTVVAGAAGAGLLGAAVVVRKPVLPWKRLLVGLLLVILFIPIRRYKLPGDAGFSLEPYRVLVALLLAGWAGALLVDKRVRLRRSGFELPIALILLAVMASIVVNPERASELQPAVIKSTTFLISFMLVFYLVVSVVRTRDVLDTLIKTLVGGGAVIAVLAVIEARTGFTPFTRVDTVLPILKPDPTFTTEIGRGSTLRAFGPAEHPIALGAALVMIVPLALYVVRTADARWYWYPALGALVVGVLSTVSRTGVVMLIVIGIVFLWLRFRETRRLWPILLPLVVATQFAAPGTLGSLASAFFPEDGLITEQEGMAGSCSSSGRVADIGPTLDDVGEKPFLGYGFGTRITTGIDSNACILDNQWLGTLVDVGIFGFVAWILLFRTVLRRLGRRAKTDRSDTGWLLVAVTASMMAYAVGNLTFDALGFSQVTFMLFIILGLGAAAAANEPAPASVVVAATARGRARPASRAARPVLHG